MEGLKMELAKLIWNVLVMGFALAYCGILARVTLSLGKSAIDLHERGLFDISKYNRMLVGDGDTPSESRLYSVKE